MSIKWDTLKTKEDIDNELHQAECEKVRAERDSLLIKTDFYALTDTPDAPQSVLSYRKALRDITLQVGFPYNVEWPTLDIGV